jgi:hypothetical protein
MIYITKEHCTDYWAYTNIIKLLYLTIGILEDPSNFFMCNSLKEACKMLYDENEFSLGKYNIDWGEKEYLFCAKIPSSDEFVPFGGREEFNNFCETVGAKDLLRDHPHIKNSIFPWLKSTTIEDKRIRIEYLLILIRKIRKIIDDRKK